MSDRKAIVFTDPDWPTCRIIYCYPNDAEKELERLKNSDDLKSLYPNGFPNARIINESDIPSDRLFRMAWTDEYDTPTIDINLDKAKEIHLERVRAKRQEEFIKLGFPHKLNEDLEKAIIPEDTQKKLKDLRDIPQNLNLDNCITPDDIVNTWPEELPLHEDYQK